MGRRPYSFPAGYGIIGMSERAASLNGTFEAKNRPDGRVVVEARLPAQEVHLDRTAEAPQETVLQ